MEAQTFHGGVLLGITAAQVDGDTYSGYNKPGIIGGVFITTSRAHRFGGKMEIRYAARGAKEPAADDNTGYYKLALHYIDVPVMVTYSFKKFGQIEAGLIPGYLFAIHGEDDYGIMPSEYITAFRKFDLGTLIGVNIQLLPSLSLNFRYSYSIFSIREDETEGSYYSWYGRLFGYSSGDYNNYLALSINYLIR